jgi:hypothetical protein
MPVTKSAMKAQRADKLHALSLKVGLSSSEVGAALIKKNLEK